MSRETKRASPRPLWPVEDPGRGMSTVTTIAPEAATAAKVLPGRPAPPATLVIFGAGGDLTKRLVVPALYNLVQAGKLPDEFAVIGVDHNEQTSEQWRQNLTKMMQAFTRAAGHRRAAWSWLTRACAICLEILPSLKPSAVWRNC